MGQQATEEDQEVDLQIRGEEILRHQVQPQQHQAEQSLGRKED